MNTAQRYIQEKKLLPTELTTAEYQAAMPAQLLERSMVMACVTEAKYLSENKKVIEAITAGRMSPRAAREHLRRFYEAQGYQPREGEAGTIKDLSSVRRMKATIDTNVAMARGRQRKVRLAANKGHPAAELIRMGAAMVPRDWQARWSAAFAEVGGEGALRSPMIALHDSPIWVALSAFGNPYPPFDWGSHMNIRPVSLQRCLELGLIKGEAEAEPALVESLNAHSRFEVEGLQAEIKEVLERKVRGFGQLIKGGVQLMDLDGTSPKTSKELAADFALAKKQGLESMQAKALAKWIHNNLLFAPSNTSGERATLSEQLAIRELLDRMKSESSEQSGEMLYRGISASSMSKLKPMLDKLERDGTWSAREGYVAESASVKESVARRFATGKKYGFILEYRNYQSRKKTSDLYASLDIANKNAKHPE